MISEKNLNEMVSSLRKQKPVGPSYFQTTREVYETIREIEPELNLPKWDDIP